MKLDIYTKLPVIQDQQYQQNECKTANTKQNHMIS